MRTHVAILIALLLLASCGGGGTGAPPVATGNVDIISNALSPGNVGQAFFQQMVASGGQQPYSWWVSTSGEPLPDGMAMTPDGRLAGIPTESALRTVVVVVQDIESSLDLVSLTIEVRDIEIAASTTGAVLPGANVSFTASGGSAGYSFQLSANQSGGFISTGGSYIAGNSSGVDVVRATDRDGFYEELAVTVGADPFVGFTEAWGSSDVWWINWDVVYDPDPSYASDFDEVLVALGLRATGSTGVNGSEADDIARLLLIRRTLAHLSTYYGNGIDGNPQPGGLSVSFVGPAGPSSGATPGVGSVIGAQPDRYNTICVRHGPSAGVVGTAWLDNSNTNIEHNCGNPQSTALGIFANRVLSPYLSSYNNSIASNPVGAADVDGLRELLFGAAPSNGREQAIFSVADGFGKTLAAVLAHEVGHSLGLNHSSPSEGAGDIMNASLNVGPSVAYAFNAGHWSTLLSNLPGPNR